MPKDLFKGTGVCLRDWGLLEEQGRGLLKGCLFCYFDWGLLQGLVFLGLRDFFWKDLGLLKGVFFWGDWKTTYRSPVGSFWRFLLGRARARKNNLPKPRRLMPALRTWKETKPCAGKKRSQLLPCDAFEMSAIPQQDAVEFVPHSSMLGWNLNKGQRLGPR